jgi:hypothetical protein
VVLEPRIQRLLRIASAIGPICVDFDFIVASISPQAANYSAPTRSIIARRAYPRIRLLIHTFYWSHHRTNRFDSSGA